MKKFSIILFKAVDHEFPVRTISGIGAKIVNRDEKFKTHDTIIYIKDKESAALNCIYRILRTAKLRCLIVSELNFARSRIYRYNAPTRYFANYSGAKRTRRRNTELKETII
jgi:hypothetical protein